MSVSARRGRYLVALGVGAVTAAIATPTSAGAQELPEPTIDVQVVCSDDGGSFVVTVTPDANDPRPYLEMYVEIVDQGAANTSRYDDYAELPLGTYTFPDDGLPDGDTDPEGPYVDSTYRVIVEVIDSDAPSDSDAVAYLLDFYEVDCQGGTTTPTEAPKPGSGAPLPETGSSSAPIALAAGVMLLIGAALLVARRARPA